MSLGLRAKLIIIVGLLSLIIVSNFGILWIAEKNIAKQQGEVVHTYSVIKESERFLGHLRDAETGQRGFLLTGQTKYLAPYDQGVAAAFDSFQRLQDLTRDNQVQQARLKDISKQMSLKLAELRETIILRQQGQYELAMEIVNSGAGKVLMDDLRREVSEFINLEEGLLVQRKSDFDATQKLLRQLLIGETVFLIVLLVIVAFVIQRNVIAPVIRLKDNAADLAAGKNIEDIDIPAIAAQDEIGQLIGVFNEMARRINTTLNRLVISQREAEEKKAHLSEVIWSTSAGTWELDVKTGQVKINNRWANIIGYHIDEIHTMKALDFNRFCHPEDKIKSQDLLEKHFSGELDYYECESRWLHKKGYWVWILDRGKVVEWSPDGKPLRISGTITDISDRKAIEQLKSEFVSTVSHELRTPLTSIKGALSIVKSGSISGDPERLQSLMEIAFSNVSRLELLINDILDIEKIEAGKIKLNLQPIDIMNFVDQAIEVNKGFGDEFGVRFIHINSDQPALVKADQARLMQVLTNLMSNAAKFSPRGSDVILEVSRCDQTVRVAVKDNGPGVPEEFQANLFDKFSQADGSDSRKIGGTGLGLSIAKALVEQHGGTIGFETEVGVGSTFFFDLPGMARR